MKQSVEVSGVYHCNSLLLVNHTLVNKVARNLKSSLSRSLTVSCLKHIKLFILNGKFHILHISVVVFKSFAYILELCESFGELFCHLSDRHRCTNACNNVLALCVCKELTHKLLLTGSRVSCESNTCSAVVTHITESHHLNVNGCTPRIRNIVIAAVYVRSGVIPGTEYGLDSAHKLFLRVGGEVFADFFFIFSLELTRKLFKVISGKLNILSYASISLHLVNQLFKVFLSNFHNNV